jgi:hypothetical protein
MATTLEIIQSNLAALGFVNPSNAAIFNEIAVAVATPVDNTIQELNNAEAAILDLITNKNYGKPGYYIAAALAFQYGYNLSVDTVTQAYYYATIDTAAQIVKQAAFESSLSGLFLKIATLNTTTNLLEPLDSLELDSFTNYFKLSELPGLPVTIINNAANILNFNANCTYYAQYDLVTLQTNISNALNTFRNNFLFDGVLYITDLESYLAANVPGVRSFFISSQTIDSTPFTGSVALSSGYFNYFSAILSQITYLPI